MAGIVIWKLLPKGGKMPDLVGKTFSESALPNEGLVVQRVDSLAADTVKFRSGAVISQSIAPETKLEGTKDKPDTVRIVVQKDFTLVPLDLQYRSTADLKLNAFWPQNYITEGGAGDVFYDDMVIAKSRIGCIQ